MVLPLVWSCCLGLLMQSTHFSLHWMMMICFKPEITICLKRLFNGLVLEPLFNQGFHLYAGHKVIHESFYLIHLGVSPSGFLGMENTRN